MVYAFIIFSNINTAIKKRYLYQNHKSKFKPYSCIYLPFLLDIGAKATFDIAI